MPRPATKDADVDMQEEIRRQVKLISNERFSAIEKRLQRSEEETALLKRKNTQLQEEKEALANELKELKAEKLKMQEKINEQDTKKRKTPASITPQSPVHKITKQEENTQTNSKHKEKKQKNRWDKKTPETLKQRDSQTNQGNLNQKGTTVPQTSSQPPGTGRGTKNREGGKDEDIMWNYKS